MISSGVEAVADGNGIISTISRFSACNWPLILKEEKKVFQDYKPWNEVSGQITVRVILLLDRSLSIYK